MIRGVSPLKRLRLEVRGLRLRLRKQKPCCGAEARPDGARIEV
jgi:hypothetical protein